MLKLYAVLLKTQVVKNVVIQLVLNVKLDHALMLDNTSSCSAKSCNDAPSTANTDTLCG